MFQSKSKIDAKKFYQIICKTYQTNVFNKNHLKITFPNLNYTQVNYRLTRLVHENYLKQEGSQFQVKDLNQDYHSRTERSSVQYNFKPQELLQKYPAIVRFQDKPFTRYSLAGKIYEGVRYFNLHHIPIQTGELIDFYCKKYHLPRNKFESQASRFIQNGYFKKDEFKHVTLTNIDVPYYLPRIIYNYHKSNAYNIYMYIKQHQGTQVKEILDNAISNRYFTIRRNINKLKKHGFIKGIGNTKACQYYITDKPLTNWNQFFGHSKELVNLSNPIKKIKYLNNLDEELKPLIQKLK